MEKRITKFDCCKQEINVPGTVVERSTLTAELGSTNMVFPEPHTNPSTVDCEESEEDSYDDVDDDDEDADIPYFSDIEMMVNITNFFSYDLLRGSLLCSGFYNLHMLFSRYLRWIYVQLMRSQISLDEVTPLILVLVSDYLLHY